MATNVEQSKLLAQLRTKSAGAWKRARKVEPKARGMGGLPPNTKDVVAKITGYKFDKTKADPKKPGSGNDPFFSMGMVVVEPPEHANRRLAINWFLNESQYATLEENMENLANDLGLMNKALPDDIAGVPAIFQELVDEQTHIIVHSGGPRSNDRTPNIFIDGIAEGYQSNGALTNVQEPTNEPDGTDQTAGETEEVGEPQEGDTEEVVDADAGGTEEEVLEPLAVDDGFSVVIGKDDPHNCTIAVVAEDGKHTVVMVDGPNQGKRYKVMEDKLLAWIEAPKPKPKAAAKPKTAAKKPAGKRK